jgi:branched-chain amino acid aminotransferase
MQRSQETLIYLDGAFIPAHEARISVYDHGLLYGDGIFEGIRAYAGFVFQLKEHIDRLYRSARSLRLALSQSPQQMCEIVLEVLRRNHLQDAYIRLVVTRGTGALGPDPTTCLHPSIIVIAEALAPVHGIEAIQKGIRVVIVPTRRDSIDATSHEVKSLNYLNSVIARIESSLAHADEAIMLDARGFVCESPICNVFLVQGDMLATPSVASGILHGITRHQVMILGEQVGLKVKEKDITPYELLHADEVFLTGTHAEIVPVVTVNGLSIGDGSVGKHTQKLLLAFRQITRDPRYGIPIGL